VATQCHPLRGFSHIRKANHLAAGTDRDVWNR
jgi:hypothetical protein